jgi:AcrR family transcriptional regulator
VTAARPEKQDNRAGAEEAPARGRGRPRSEKANQAILDSTLKLLGEHGVAGLTIEGVAAEAGVGKTTVYRRWETKADLITAAVSRLAPPGEPPDTGSLDSDLRTFAMAQRKRVTGTPLLNAAPRVLAESADYPDIHAGFVRAAIEPVRAAIRLILERAIERGELRKDADLEALVDILQGIPIYLLLLGAGDPSALARLPEPYLSILMDGVSSSSAAPASARPRSSKSSRAKPARS